MKNTFLSILCIIFFILSIVPLAKNINYYAVLAEVVEVDRANNTVIYRTLDGFEYSYKCCCNFSVGDMVSLCMNDKGTELYNDDRVVNARRENIQRKTEISRNYNYGSKN